MTQNLTAAQQAHIDNRDASGKWKSKAHGDVEDPAGTLGLVDSESSPERMVTRGIDGERGGFEADLEEARPGEVPVLVRESPDGHATYSLGDGKVTITQIPSQTIDLPDGRTHQTGSRFVVEDHAEDQPRPVIQSSDDPRLNSSTAQRAVEHLRALDAGRDPLNEALDGNHHPGRDGLPDSYGFDIREADEDAQALARNLQSRFDDHGTTDVVAYDSGGGNEAVGVFGGLPDALYEVRATSVDGGSLDAPGWSVTAVYQVGSDEWVEDDDELVIDPIVVEDSSDTDSACRAVEHRLAQVKAKVAASREG